MNAQDFLTTDDVRIADSDLTVETTGTQQCRIQHVRTVGRSNQDNALIGFKTVHLNQQLVERLLALIIAAAEASAA